MKRISLILIIIVCLASIIVYCKKDTKDVEVSEDETEFLCSCPHCVIYLQPYGDFTEKEAKSLVPILKKNFDTFLEGGWEFKVNPHKELPADTYVKERDRYKAYNILKKMKQEFKSTSKKREVYIGLTHKDICTDLRGFKDFGIVGLSFCPGYVCIVSDKRISDKTQMWKPVMHEFMHAFYGSKHCPNDDPHCFMKDAKGKPNFKIQNKLCDACRQ